jgi:hypothetical protein
MAQAISFLILLFFAIPTHSFAEYLCSSESKNDRLLFKDNRNQIWEVNNLKFTKTSFLESYLSCAQFIEKTDQVQNRSAKLSPLYPASQLKSHFIEKNHFFEHCLESPVCRMSPLDNLFYPDFLIRHLWKPSVFDRTSICNERSLLSEETQPVEPVQRFGITQTWEIPKDSLEGKLFQFLDKNRPTKLLFSSMIFSEDLFHRLDQWLIKNPGSQAWIFLSYNLEVLMPGFPEQFKSVSGRINLVPMFQDPINPFTYHIKGAVFLKDQPHIKKQWLLLMSANWRRYSEENVKDKIFITENKQLSSAYTQLLYSILEDRCSSLRYLDCSNSLRYAPSDRRAAEIKELIKKSCESLKEWPAKIMHDEALQASAPFARPGTQKVEQKVIELIEHAQKSILLASHVFGESRISQELIKAQARGVKVQLLLGTKLANPFFEKTLQQIFNVDQVTEETGVTAHAKFMIIDDDLAIWTTGNFTKTSLQNPWEIFLFIKDPQFIGVLKEYLMKTLQ